MTKRPVAILRPMAIIVLCTFTLIGCFPSYNTRDFSDADPDKAKSRLGSAVFVYSKCPITEGITGMSDGLQPLYRGRFLDRRFSGGQPEIRGRAIPPITFTPAGVASAGAGLALTAIGKYLERQKSGLNGQFIAGKTKINRDGNPAKGCLVVTRGFFGTPPANTKRKGAFSNIKLEKLGLSDHPRFYFEAGIVYRDEILTLKPVYLNYARSSARNTGSGRKNVGLTISFMPVGVMEKEKVLAVFSHDLGKLEIGKYYEGERIFTGTSLSRKIALPDVFDVTVLVSESEDTSLALETFAEAFKTDEEGFRTAMKRLLKKAVKEK